MNSQIHQKKTKKQYKKTKQIFNNQLDKMYAVAIVSVSIMIFLFVLLIAKKRKDKRNSMACSSACGGLCPLTVTSEMQLFVCSMDTTQQVHWLELEAMINEHQNNFAQRLRGDYAMLTENDIRFLLLLRTDMTNTDIAKRMNIQGSSFRIRRSRLKKKMQIETSSFSEYIKKLYTE